MNLTTAVRLNWLGNFISPLFYIPLVLFGFSPEIIVTSLAVSLFFQFFLHTEAVGKLGFFEGLFFNTPSAHRVHHGCNEKYIDKNYGGMLILFDRMFGTYQREEEKVKYGTTTGFLSHNPIIINFSPLLQFLKGGWKREKQRVTEKGLKIDLTKKKILQIFILVSIPFFTKAQQTINYSITVHSVQREFILYVPASYNASTSVPLVFSFHGLGGNAQVQMEDHDFRPVADTAGFIVAHPLGQPVAGPALGWNFGNNSLQDDVLFTSIMIDTIAADFNINLDRVYACGMSFGGFFSVYLAGQLSDKIASIASVAGTILNTTPNSLIAPTRPIAFLEIHGTNDNNVAYNGSQASKSVQYVLDLFVNHNNCDTIPSITALPDVNPNDGSTVEHYIYANGDNGVTVEHLKIDGGRHTWPDENTNTQGVNRDINGCVEIWNFFSKFDINGAIGSLSSVEPISSLPAVSIYPNPAQEYINIEIKLPKTDIRIFNYSGQEFNLPTNNLHENIEIDIRSIPSGFYIISLAHDGEMLHTTFIKQ